MRKANQKNFNWTFSKNDTLPKQNKNKKDLKIKLLRPC